MLQSLRMGGIRRRRAHASAQRVEVGYLFGGSIMKDEDDPIKDLFYAVGSRVAPVQTLVLRGAQQGLADPKVTPGGELLLGVLSGWMLISIGVAIGNAFKG